MALEVSPTTKEYCPVVVKHEPGQQIFVMFSVNDEWKVLPEEHIDRGDDDSTKTVWTGPPRSYLVCGANEMPTIVNIVREGKPEPKPQPEPDPDDEETEPDPPKPDPEPDPQPDGMLAKWIVILEEQAERINHPEKVNVMESLTADGEVFGCKAVIYEDDSTNGKPFRSKTEGHPLPVMILVTDDGDPKTKETYRAFPLPATREEVDRILSENIIR